MSALERVDQSQRNPSQELVSQIRSEQFVEQIRIALPGGVTPERFVRIAATAIMQNGDLVKANRESLFKALMRCAQDGLLPDGKQAALPVYKGQVGYIPMIDGLRQIAIEHGWLLRCCAVFANDEFDHTDEPPSITHRSVRFGEPRGDLVTAYAVAIHRDGRRLQRVLHPDEIAQRRGMAQTEKVWSKWTAEMFEKTAGRMLFGDLPLDPAEKERASRIVAAMDSADPAVLMYGPGVRELGPPAFSGEETFEEASASDEGSAADADSATADSQQAGDAVEGSTAPSAAPEAGPDFGGEAVPSGDVSEEDVAAATEAAGFVVKVQNEKSWVNGLTLEQIHAEGEVGVEFFRTVLAPGWADGLLKRAAVAYCRVRHPELVEGGQQ